MEFKWFGKHIWDLVSLFRNKVGINTDSIDPVRQLHVKDTVNPPLRLEGVQAVEEEINALVINSSGDVFKNGNFGWHAKGVDESAHILTDQWLQFRGDNGITIDLSASGAGVELDPYIMDFSHADTSSQADVIASARRYITSVDLDTYGHVVGLGTATETVTDTNTMGSGFTVSATTDSTATTITEGNDLMFTAGTGITCETTGSNAVTITNTISAIPALTTEEVQDIVGGMVSSNTETGIAVTYVDGGVGAGKLNFVLNDPFVGDVQGDLTGDILTAVQPNITTLAGVTALGTAGNAMTVTCDHVTFGSVNASDPLVNIHNTANDNSAPRLRFIKNRGVDGVDADNVGEIAFRSYDDGTPATQDYAKIKTQIKDSATGNEQGKLLFSVATLDGTLRNGLIVKGHDDDLVDVELARGSASTVSIAGDLDVTSTITGDVTGDLTGKADTADELETARTIGGVSFDGSGNIDLPGVNTAGSQNTSGTAAGLSATLSVASGGTNNTTMVNKGVCLTQGAGTKKIRSFSMATDGDILVGGATSGPGIESADDLAGTGLTAVTGDRTLTLNVDAAQTGITSVGTLASLTVGGDIISDTDSTDNLGSTGVRFLNTWSDTVTGTTATFTDVGGTLSTVAQPNITSLGTLTGLNVQSTKSAAPYPGTMISVRGSNVTDSSTSASGTAAKYTHVSIEKGRLLAANLSVTTTDAATLYIDGPMDEHTNQTIVNNWALWVDAGNVRFDGDLKVDGDIDLEGDIDVNGTLETDALTIAGSNILSGGIITTVGTISSGTWNGTDIGVEHGGTGVGTLTDGGVLLGSGTGAITPMAVLSDGEMIVGDGTGDPVAESGATLRTSVGVGTGDSPEFTAVNFGHATNNTLSSPSTGNLQIESNIIYRAGGTDIPIADGGTGQSSAAAGFDALSPFTAAGDILYGGTSGTGTRLAAGASNIGKVLQCISSGAVGWASAGAGDITSVVAGDGLSGGGTTGDVTLDIEVSQPDITTLAGVTAIGTAGANVLCYSDFRVGSASAQKPVLSIENYTNDADSGVLKFIKDKGAAGANDDVCGTITFFGDDSAEAQTEFARIEGIVANAANGAEGGRLTLSVATHDSEIQPGLIIQDGDLEDEIDVTIGSGSASRVTIPGKLEGDFTSIFSGIDDVTITAVVGTEYLCDDAGGGAMGLPAVYQGARITIVIGTTLTGNMTITAQAGDFLNGYAIMVDNIYPNAGTAKHFRPDGTSDLIITMNGGVKGGIAGSKIELIGISDTEWRVRGTLYCDGTLESPFT